MKETKIVSKQNLIETIKNTIIVFFYDEIKEWETIENISNSIQYDNNDQKYKIIFEESTLGKHSYVSKIK